MSKILEMSESQRLRFAIMVRVSTEGQEKKGESLRTQRAYMTEVIERRGDTIVKSYGGQEHATPGFETVELDRLLIDAKREIKPFDAVMVATADRWSRNNAKSTEALTILKQSGIRFFVGDTEYNLVEPDHIMYLGLSAVIGQFHAQNQNSKSIKNRIARAERGIPAAGILPYGRTYSKATGWGVDPEKKRKIEEIAARYLKGEWISALAKEYGIDRSCLYVILKERSGTTWCESFESKSLRIHKVVTHTVPPLLPDETISAVVARVAANRTYYHRHLKNKYLLSRMVICAHCGGALSGQPNPDGKLWYRHMKPHLVAKPCPVEKTWIPAADLDDQVLRQLFETFGNPLAIQRAIEAATPNTDKLKEARARILRIDELLQKVRKGVSRIIKLVASGIVSESDAATQLTELKTEERTYQDERDTLSDIVGNLPTREGILAKANDVAGQFGYFGARLWAKRRDINSQIQRMTWEEKRGLVQMVFGGRTAEGRRMGVHIEWDGSVGRLRKWRYSILGHFINEEGWSLFSPARRRIVFADCTARRQKLLVTNSALP